MLCAKYDYKTDIAVKQEEAFERGQEQKTIEAARAFYANGVSIELIAKSLKINPDEILVVHDELELPLGTVSLKWSGGLGGHNGLRSTKAVLGTADFWRLRFGLTKPVDKDIAAYVLSRFSGDEQIMLSQAFSQTNEMFAKLLLTEDASRILQGWSKRKCIA